jgi:hypothetical protein
MATNKTLPTVIGIGLVASVIAITLLLQPREPRQLQPAMTQAWTDLLVCLRGPALHDGELLTQRLRNIELAGARDKGWPQRCVLGEAPPMLKRPLLTARTLPIIEPLPIEPLPSVPDPDELALSDDSTGVCQSGTHTFVVWRSHSIAVHDGASWAEHRPEGAPAKEAKKKRVERKSVADAADQFGMIGLLNSGDKAEPSGFGHPDAPTAPKGMFEPSPRKPRKRQRSRLPRETLTCDGGAAALTWRVAEGPTTFIRERRCTYDSCQFAEVRLDDLDVKAWWLASSTGDNTTIVWRANDGAVRMRRAPLRELPTAASVPLLDSKRYGGPATRDLRVFVSTDAILFQFRSDAGFRGIRIAGDRITALEKKE